MTSTVTDAELGKFWDEMELEDRIQLLRRIGFNNPKTAETLYLNWAGIFKSIRLRLRKGILSGSNRWNHHIRADPPGVVGGVPPEQVKEVPPVEIGSVQQRQQRRSDTGGRHRKTKEVIGELKTCSRCGIIFGADGPDTLEFSRTGQCERCLQEQMAGRILNDRAGEEVFSRLAPVYTSFTSDGRDIIPRDRRAGRARKTKWE